MGRRRAWLGAVALSLCPAGIAACAGGQGPVAARVGGTPIREATVASWARALEAGSAAGPASAPAHASAREKALDYLISAHWLLGEATERGLAPSERAVRHGIEERIEAAPGGRAEFQGGPSEQTIAGLRLEVRAELAAERLRAMVSRTVAPVTHAEIAAYYRRHRAIYRIRQQRRVDLVENVPSRVAAIALGRRLGTGRRFAARAYHEFVPSTPPYLAHTPKFNTGLLHAIFTARAGELTGPVPFNNAWTLFVVRRIAPGKFIALQIVEPLIAKRLSEDHRRAALARFTGPYESEWRARTSCTADYRIAKCRQYSGPAQAEADPLGRA